MNAFSSFIISVSAACVLLSAVYILCPEGKLKAPLKYTFSLAFLCCICALSAAGQSIEFDLVPSGNTQFEQFNAEAVAKDIFQTALSEQDIPFSKIEVLADKLQTGSISIIRVTVYSSAPEEKILKVIGSDAYEVVVLNE